MPIRRWPQTLKLIRRVGPRAVPFHDWWLNLLVTGAGGDILYDTQPGLLYRQHAGNALGLNHGLRPFLRRLPYQRLRLRDIIRQYIARIHLHARSAQGGIRCVHVFFYH